jgi:hypothetical protein
MKMHIIILCFFVISFVFNRTSLAQNDLSITLVNKTGFEFVDLYISPAGENKWGQDLNLGIFDKMEAKEFKLTMKDKVCEFDLRAVMPDSTQMKFEKINLCRMPIITLLYEFDKPLFVQDIIIDNRTNYTFSELYIKESNSSIWGTELLGANMLTPNENVAISLKPGSGKNCRYDIKAVLMNGREIIYDRMDVCHQDHVVLFLYQGRPNFGFE